MDMTGYNREEINGINCRFLQVSLETFAAIACVVVRFCPAYLPQLYTSNKSDEVISPLG